MVQQRLLPHANRCIQQLSTVKVPSATEDQDIDDAFNNLGLLYADQGKMAEAEKMYQRALEKSWGPEHTSTLDTVNNLGLFYNNQGKLDEAEKMYQLRITLQGERPSQRGTLLPRGLQVVCFRSIQTDYSELHRSSPLN